MNTVAIVGRSKETVGKAPFNDTSVHIWAYNDHAMQIPRVTMIFETHPDWYTTDRYTQEYRDWVQTSRVPVIMHDHDDRIPNSIPYPFDEIGEKLGGHLWIGDKPVRDFYTSTTPYAIALAILMGYARIEFYGIELYDNGYHRQGFGIFYWIGQATARGIDVAIAPGSKLYEPARYPVTF